MMRWSGNLFAARCYASLAILLLVFLAVTEVHAGRRKRGVDLLVNDRKQARIAHRALPSVCSQPSQGLCCPAGQTLQFGGTAGVNGCCPIGQQGTTQGTCCPPGTDAIIAYENSVALIPAPTSCCPTGYKFVCKNDPGNLEQGSCCPGNQYSTTQGCCAAGTAYVSSVGGSTQCCGRPLMPDGDCPGGLGGACEAAYPNPCNGNSAVTCYQPSGDYFGTCLLRLVQPCVDDSQCAPYSPDQFDKSHPIKCRLALLAPDALTSAEGTSLQQYEQDATYATRGVTTCTSFYTDNAVFGRCDPKDPNACTGGTTTGPYADAKTVCTYLPYNGDYACLGAPGVQCRQPGQSAQLVGDPANGFCASGDCDIFTNKCSFPNSGSSRARRGDVKETPTAFEKPGEHRILLRTEQAAAMIAGHGVFRYQNRLVQDKTFMRARSAWKRALQTTTLGLQTYQPDMFVDMAMRALSSEHRQFALSDNVKIWSGDVPHIIRNLLDNPHFVSFDWNWVHVNRAGLQALYERLNVTVPRQGQATRTVEFEQEM